MASHRFIFSKLVRDHIPEILASKEISLSARAVDDVAFKEALKSKLLEEAKELQKAATNDEMKEELADILEVLYAFMSASGIPMDELEAFRCEKKRVKGGFENRIFADYVTIDDKNPAIQHYQMRPKDYPIVPNKGEQQDCIFCKLVHDAEKRPIYRHYRHCFAIKDRYPVSPGHLLIIPYEHTENWFTATEAVRNNMMEALQELKEHVDREYKPDGYNIGLNCGQSAGQTVMHLHMHLIPRYSGDMCDPQGGVRGAIPSKQKY